MRPIAGASLDEAFLGGAESQQRWTKALAAVHAEALACARTIAARMP